MLVDMATGATLLLAPLGRSGMAPASGSEEAHGFRADGGLHGGGGVRQQLAADVELVVILLKIVRTFACMLRPVTSTVGTVRYNNTLTSYGRATDAQRRRCASASSCRQ